MGEVNDIPEDWFDCPVIGDGVQNLIFPLKVILDERFNKVVPSKKRFNISTANKLFKLNSIRLLIDLTRENVFYDPTKLKGISYVRIFEVGEEGMPTTLHTDKFIRVIKEAVTKDHRGKIGVHCLHGFNLTGYMIVVYLVNVKKLSLHRAATLFAEARPPGIFKSEYIEELNELFHPILNLTVPEEPDWMKKGECKKATRITKALPRGSKMSKVPQISLTESVMAERRAAAMKNFAILAQFNNKKKELFSFKIPHFSRPTVASKSDNLVMIEEAEEKEYVPPLNISTKISTRESRDKSFFINHDIPLIRSVIAEKDFTVSSRKDISAPSETDASPFGMDDYSLISSLGGTSFTIKDDYSKHLPKENVRPEEIDSFFSFNKDDTLEESQICHKPTSDIIDFSITQDSLLFKNTSLNLDSTVSSDSDKSFALIKHVKDNLSDASPIAMDDYSLVSSLDGTSFAIKDDSSKHLPKENVPPEEIDGFLSLNKDDTLDSETTFTLIKDLEEDKIGETVSQQEDLKDYIEPVYADKDLFEVPSVSLKEDNNILEVNLDANVFNNTETVSDNLVPDIHDNDIGLPASIEHIEGHETLKTPSKKRKKRSSSLHDKECSSDKRMKLGMMQDMFSYFISSSSIAYDSIVNRARLNIPDFYINSRLIIPIRDNFEVEFLRNKVRSILKTSIYGFVGAKYTNLSWKNIHQLKTVFHWNTWTTNGKRYLLFVVDKDETYFIDENNWFYRVFQLEFPDAINKNAVLRNTVFDGEFVIKQGEKKLSYRYLISNVYAFEGQRYNETKFRSRIKFIEKIILIARKNLDHNAINKEPFKITLKRFSKARELNNIWNNMRGALEYEMTGLVFYPTFHDLHNCLKARIIFLWQPPESKTIDFKLKTKLDDAGEKVVGELYVHGSNVPYASITNLSLPDLKKFENKIVKCKLSACTREWTVLDEQTERKTAISKWDIKDMVEDLSKPVLFDDIVLEE